MKSIKQEKDPSAYITRLIPLGMRMGENDERLTIEEVNNGVKYIDDTNAIALYGIHVGFVEWDDVTQAENLLTKGQAWLRDNNKLQVKYSITALDLSLLGLDVDDFEVYNYHPIINPLLGIDDVARIIKKNLDVCEEVKSTIEIGDSFKSLSDIQISQAQQTKKMYSEITKTAEEIRLEVADEIEGIKTEVIQLAEGLTLTVSNGSTSSTLTLMLGETVLASQKISFDGYVTFTGLKNGTTTIDGGCIKTGEILADLITTGVLQSADGKTFKLDLDSGTFVMQGSGRFENEDGTTYITVDGDEIVMFSDSGDGFLEKLRIGFSYGPNPYGSGNVEYPHILFGNANGGQVGLIKKFWNGLWMGNSSPLDEYGIFEGCAGAVGLFVDTTDGKTYVVNGEEMKNIYTGAAIAKFA